MLLNGLEEDPSLSIALLLLSTYNEMLFWNSGTTAAVSSTELAILDSA